MPESPAFRHLQKLYEGGTAYTPHVLTACGRRHPARLYCWWWKDTLHVHTVGDVKTPRTSPLRVRIAGGERHPARPYMAAGVIKLAL
jgi:hypothetical protein